MISATEGGMWAGRLRDLGLAVRRRLATVWTRDADSLATPVAHEGGDTIYALDRHVEPVLVAEIERWGEPVCVIAEGFGAEGRLEIGAPGGAARHRLIIDPIDGTRGLMYNKRSAWFLAAVARNRGEATSLAETFAAALVELPTSKQAWADSFSAYVGGGVDAQRLCSDPPGQRPLQPRPSRATTLKDGFAQVANFFPGTKVLASELMERIVAATLGKVCPGSGDVFDDQYISSGGQMAELILGHDRFCGDLRPLFYRLLERTAGDTTRGLECHPYDVAGALVAREAGVIITDGLDRPLDCPLNVQHPVHWCGYANEALHRQIAPVIQAWLRERGL